MQRKAIQQKAEDLRLFWRGCACGLFQKDLALRATAFEIMRKRDIIRNMELGSVHISGIVI